MRSIPPFTADQFTVRLLFFNLLLQIAIVLLHTMTNMYGTLMKMGIHISDYPGFELFTSTTTMLISNSSMIFFVLSGFLFFKNFDKPGAYRDKIGRRVYTLLLPYIVWNLLASKWTMNLLIPLLTPFVPSLHAEAAPMTLVQCFVGEAPAYLPADAPLWFVRNLIGVMLISPLIWRAVRSIWSLSWLCSTGALWMTLWIVGKHNLSDFAMPLFGFSFGAYLNANKVDFFNIDRRAFVASLTLLIAIMLSPNVLPGNPYAGFLLSLPKLACISVILLYISTLCAKSEGVRRFAPLGYAAFFLYLAHTIGMSQIIEVVWRLINPSDSFEMILTAVFCWLATVAFWLTVWLTLRRFAPGLLYVLTGGRLRSRCVPRVQKAG